MIPCPSCKKTLTETDFQNGKCPQCGIALGGGTVVDTNGVGPSQTIELSRIQGTIDSDSVVAGANPRLHRELLDLAPLRFRPPGLNRLSLQRGLQRGE